MEQVNSRFNDAGFCTQGTSEHGYYPGKQNHAILLQGQLVKLKCLCHHIILIIIIIITCLRRFVVRQIGTWLVLTKIQPNSCITVTQSALLDNVGSNFEHPGLKRSTLDFTPFFTLTFGYSEDIAQGSLSRVRALCWRTQGTKKGVPELGITLS